MCQGGNSLIRLCISACHLQWEHIPDDFATLSSNNVQHVMDLEMIKALDQPRECYHAYSQQYHYQHR